MQETPSERRLAENEVVFRQLNEQIHSGFAETNQMALEDNQPQFIVDHKDDDAPLHFYCECSDEKCTQRILMNIHDYQKLHKHRNRFTIVPGHETLRIEKIVAKKPGYVVVEKLVAPPQTADSLHPTALNNN